MNAFNALPTYYCYRYGEEWYHEMLSYIDVLVDGPFIEELKNVSLKFRGSSNQRILKLKAKS